MSRGYTAVEVMMSLALLGIGATGVIALQKATLIGNTQARNLATANAIAATWVERLRTEALMWNAPGGTDDLATDTQWLKLAGTLIAPCKQVDPADLPPWFNPAEIAPQLTSPAGSPNADILGNDIFTNQLNTSAPAFCTKMRLTRCDAYPGFIRAEIRVYWERSGNPVTCSIVPEPGDPNMNRYGFVSVVTGIVRHEAQQ
jgi:prepilin-type N-terminal cleavage/methylation domain-containing protein